MSKMKELKRLYKRYLAITVAYVVSLNILAGITIFYLQPPLQTYLYGLLCLIYIPGALIIYSRYNRLTDKILRRK